MIFLILVHALKYGDMFVIYCSLSIIQLDPHVFTQDELPKDDFDLQTQNVNTYM